MSSPNETMTAVEIVGKGGPEVLIARTIAKPVAGPEQLLIKNVACGVNRPDVQQRKGLYPAPKCHSPIPGLEIAGHVESVGSGTGRFKVGDAVMALVNGGGYATHTIAEEGACLPVPKSLGMTQAGGMPETFFTVWHNVFERGRLKRGDWILIHGGSSGIGVAAIQLEIGRAHV